MDIRSALDRIIAIQDGLAITDPIAEDVKKAYKYVPRANVTLTDVPAFTNEWTLTSLDRFVSFRIQNYTVHMQLFVEDADIDRAADIASSFHKELIDALDADIALNNTVTQHSLRGGNPTLVGLERAGKIYIGLDLFLDLEMKEGATFT
jgi:hypothetical protein